MQKYIYLFAFALLFFSCNKQSKIETAVEKIPIKMKLHRFEQAFFDAKVEDLAKVKLNYPDFFPIETPDNIWISKMQNPLWRELYAEVEKKYKNFDSQQAYIEDLFKHIKYYFPTIIPPQIYTAIGEMVYLN
jgi:hypothetical protein